jgi:prolyl oligopeptidase
VPGHHLQIALALDLDGLPEFRRHGRFTAYVEGWAHYAERLADELGCYGGPLDRLGMLAAQAWRAARLVVDTGMHALGWGRAQAVDVLRRIKAGPESDVENEVDRYIVWPGQALAYKVGQRTISDLRERARRRLGARFSLPGFHDVVLRHGALPLSVLEDVVRLWEGDPA